MYLETMERLFGGTDKVILDAGQNNGVVPYLPLPSLGQDESFKLYSRVSPAGFDIGAGETLVGGDNNGELWSIDPSTGATKDLGSFGSNPSESNGLVLSPVEA